MSTAEQLNDESLKGNSEEPEVTTASSINETEDGMILNSRRKLSAIGSVIRKIEIGT